MRLKPTFALTISLLFCTLATLGLPELIHLTDDTSNDYSLVVFTANKVTVVTEQAPSSPEKAPLSPAVRHQYPATSLQSRSSIEPSADLLHPLCILRT
jgi:hypothetical protein